MTCWSDGDRQTNVQSDGDRLTGLNYLKHQRSNRMRPRS